MGRSAKRRIGLPAQFRDERRGEIPRIFPEHGDGIHRHFPLGPGNVSRTSMKRADPRIMNSFGSA